MMSPKNNSGGVFSSLTFGKRNFSSSPQKSSQQPETQSTYSLLVGAKLICHASVAAMWNGDRPLAHYSLVGVSPVSDDPTAFRAVTDKGTHLLCSVPTKACRDVWLSALNAGLEYMLSSYNKKPMSQHGSEERADLVSECHLAQGVLEHCYWMEELYATHQQEQDTMLEARRLVLKKLSKKSRRKQQSTDQEPSDSSTDEETPDRDSNGRLLPKSHTLSLEPISHDVLALTLESKQLVALQRLSPTLRSLCVEFQQGMIGVLEFIELLEAAIGIRDPAMADLKKQAFRVAGDMGTALKLLYEQCIPAPEISSSSGGGSGAKDSTELLQCILEFFLDLVIEEDELSTLAFFWPQISNIHLQMLPPRDTLSLQKIELVEDFLLTVASKHSIHLAIELVWSHTADLEDSLSGSYHGSTTTFCGRRKCAVLRFLCELESLIFDFDKGWGGGSVTIGKFMSPLDQQVELLRSSMHRIQNCRLAAVHDRLTRSYRLDKLQRTPGVASSESPESQAMEAVRVANNADYLSSHMAFIKRLCDVAEKLRFLPVNERKAALCTELGKLNASGTMGGDPTNVVKDNNEGFTRMVRIPIMEGHVFRSKARTPVLLLIETIGEGAAFVEEEEENEEQYDVPTIMEEDEEKDEHDEAPTKSEKIGDSSTSNEISDAKETTSVTIIDDAESKSPVNGDEAKCEEPTALSSNEEEGENPVLNESDNSASFRLNTEKVEGNPLNGEIKGSTPSIEIETSDSVSGENVVIGAEEGEKEGLSGNETEGENRARNNETQKKEENEDETTDALNLSVDQEPISSTDLCFTPIATTSRVQRRKVGFEDMTVPDLHATPRSKAGNIEKCPSTETVDSIQSTGNHSPRRKYFLLCHLLRRPKKPPQLSDCLFFLFP